MSGRYSAVVVINDEREEIRFNAFSLRDAREFACASFRPITIDMIELTRLGPESDKPIDFEVV